MHGRVWQVTPGKALRATYSWLNHGTFPSGRATASGLDGVLTNIVCATTANCPPQDIRCTGRGSMPGSCRRGLL